MEDMTATVRGLTIGCGTSYPFAPEFPQGVLGTADIDVADQRLARRSGETAGGDFEGGQNVNYTVRLTGTLASVEDRITDLRIAFAPAQADEQLDVRFSGTPAEYARFGRCRGILEPVWRTRAITTVSADVRCKFRANDGTKYGAEMVQAIGLASHPLPETLPFILGYHDSETINNPGLSTTDRWTVEMEAVGGSLIDPSIAHVGQGLLIFHDLDLSAGETLLVNGQERRALLNGVTPVIPTIAQWWKIEPNSNTIRFAASASSSLSSTATLTYRPGFG